MSHNLREMSAYLAGEASSGSRKATMQRCSTNKGRGNKTRFLMIVSSTCILLSFLTVGTSLAATKSNSPTNLTSIVEANTSNRSASLGKISSVATSGTKGAGPHNHQAQKQQQQQQQQVVIVEPQQSQSTDVSSMYVQIPIAEPSETGVPDGVQQTLTGEPDAGGAAGQEGTDGSQSKWTGPWPKKFQIGYIKQSDLHQVLIESLKGDTFTSLTGSSKSSGQQGASTSASSTPAPAPATKSSSSSSAASSASSGASLSKTSHSLDSLALAPPEIGALNSGSNQQSSNWPNYGTGPAAARSGTAKGVSDNLYLRARTPIGSLASTSSVLHSNFPDQKAISQHQYFPQHLQQQQPHFPIASRQFPAVNLNFARHHQQYPSLRHLQHQSQLQHPQQLQLQQQFQFAGYPSNFAKNQPMYTINNFHAQEQQQQQLQLPAFSNHQVQRAQKQSDSYYSSWRPVNTQSDESKFEQQQHASGKPLFQSSQSELGSSSFTDDFDDGFTSPVRTEPPPSLANMNRHPMLNNYLPASADSQRQAGASSSTSSLASGKTNGPSTKSRPRAIPSPMAMGTKGSGAKDAAATKGAESSDKNLSPTARRAPAGNNSTDTPSSATSTTPSSPSTEASVSTSTQSSFSSTTLASSSTAATGVTMSSTSTSSNTDPTETTEPDSESVGSETTEPSSATTTLAATASSASATTTSTVSSTATTITSGGTTQATPLSSSSTADSSAGSRADEQAEVATQESRAADSAGSSSSLPSVDESTREETTPTSTSTAPGVSNELVGSGKIGEVEGTMSDEALLAAAVRTGTEIGKSNSQVLSSRAKQTRSSERLQQQQRRKTTGKQQEVASGKKGGVGGTKSSLRTSSSGRSGKRIGNSSDQLISKDSKPKAARQVKPNSKNAGSKGGSNSSVASGKTGSKTTRMAAPGQQSERLQQSAPQIVTMSAAQAQSTAQTLASLLLSRCMSSTSCSHLLDVCGTKQAAVPLSSITGAMITNEIAEISSNLLAAGGANSSAWSMPVGLPSSGLINLAAALQADRVLRLFPQWKESVENLVDQSAQTGYTLILPSNEAIDRLPAGSIVHLQTNAEALNQLIENHIIDWVELIELAGSQQTHSGINRSAQLQQHSRLVPSKGLQINQHRERMVTINGKRLVYANQQAPAGGRIHVIDGLLEYPNTGISFSSPTTANQQAGLLGNGNGNGNLQQAKLLDIMDTLKQCDKFDGFVTLAEGTGLTQILKQDGPMTVFVPSNEALRKIPDEELEVIKNNSTALKEFLMYHVVNGSYFSQDLRDGQQLSSILDMKPIQVGVRVDGCSRRLVEANTSPMRRPDIVARNGVIHILDWYLTVRDNEWCDPIGRSPSINSSPSETSSSTTNDRLQQLASESSDVYATRLILPANHKPVYSSSSSSRQLVADQQLQLLAQGKGSSFLPTSDNEKAHNILVSATPSLDHDELVK